MNTLAKEMFLLLLMTFCSNTQANLVTVTGNKVSFTYESSLLDLFGMPTVAGDQLFFTPTAFVAKAYGEKAFDLKNSTINIKVTALNCQTAWKNSQGIGKTASKTVHPDMCHDPVFCRRNLGCYLWILLPKSEGVIL